MAVSSEYVDWLAERFAPLGPVTRKRMFSGVCLYVDDAVVAVVLGGGLFFKSDDGNAAAFDAEGCEPFRYSRGDREITVNSFRRCPDAALDDDDVMLDWARISLEAGRRAATEKARKAARKKGVAKKARAKKVHDT